MYYNNYYQQQLNQQLTLKGRNVTSLDEVRATTIDFDGSIFIFPDFAHNKIYTKQINLDGTANLKMYELGEIQQPEIYTNLDTKNFVTKDELNIILTDLVDNLTKPDKS